MNCTSFETIFNRVLDEHAPIKKKYVRANDKPFMARALRKAVMLRLDTTKIKLLKTGTNFKSIATPALSHFEVKREIIIIT